MPKKLSFGNDEEKGAITPPPPLRHPKTFNIPEPIAADPVVRRPKAITVRGTGEVHYQRRARDRTVTDILIDKAKQQDPDISMEVRGRIDILLHHTTTETLIEWGNINLQPLQQASNIQAEIAAELRRINAVEALTEARDAACHPMTFFDRISGKKPEHYETRLAMAKSDLMALMIKSERLRKSYAPEVRDLHLDAIALVVTHSEWTDSVMMQLGNSRAKTLLQAHQTGTMLLLSLGNCVQQCGQFVEQIDSMLSTTIPQWKLSQAK